MSTFRRDEIIQELANEIWRYLSSAVQIGDGPTPILATDAIATADLLTILETHLLLSPVTERMLTAAPGVVSRLPSVVARRTAELDGHVSGELDCVRTIQRRWETGEDTLFVCSPAERRFDSLHARVLQTALCMCERIAGDSKFDRGVIWESKHAQLERLDRLRRARRTSRNLKLSDVNPLRQVTEAQLDRVESRYGMQPIVDYIRFVKDVLERHETRAIRSLLTDVVLSPSTDDRLFELVVGFGLVSAFKGRGFVVDSIQAIAGRKEPFAALSKDGNRLSIWYQRSPSQVSTLPPEPSAYRQIRIENGLKPSSLRPDFILHDALTDRVVAVEVKLSASDGCNQVRTGITDALAYIKDRPDLFDSESTPGAVVVAWNAQSEPSPHSRVMVCSQDQISAIPDAFALSYGAT
jgi:hypothetical protein